MSEPDYVVSPQSVAFADLLDKVSDKLRNGGSACDYGIWVQMIGKAMAPYGE